MAKYLYGAAVQGIQAFIFQTNKLKEIAGASELVERICTSLFAELLYSEDLKPGSGSALDMLADDENAILNAAGNIKYIFEDEKLCRKIVAKFPKIVMEFAPGITISQSVVEMGEDFKESVQKLENNLRTQRNRLMKAVTIGLMGIERSRETGLPVTHVIRGKDHLDSATFHKLYDEGWKNTRKDTFLQLAKKAYGFSGSHEQLAAKLPYEISRMTGNNDWIAIIHADGNGLGKVVQKLGSDSCRFKKFSRLLDNATTNAAVKAFRTTICQDPEKSKEVIPMQPIVLSGDDHTVICRGDLAIDYTVAFLKAFEEETHNLLGDLIKDVFPDKTNHLTACAGVAFVKSSFPFHFAYNLAESLCSRAKKDSKALCNANEGNLPASALMFHKVQDSFISDFESIAIRELMPQSDISFEFGPYYILSSDPNVSNIIETTRWSVDKLIQIEHGFNSKDGNSVKSALRQWLSLLHEDPDKAQQKLDRLKSITSMRDFVDIVTKPVRRESDKARMVRYPVYDILALNTILSQVTR